MYVATVPNRNSPPAILLRESYRLDGKVKTRTIANLTRLPSQQIAALPLGLGWRSVCPRDAFCRIPSTSPAPCLTAMSPPSSVACATCGWMTFSTLLQAASAISSSP